LSSFNASLARALIVVVSESKLQSFPVVQPIMLVSNVEPPLALDAGASLASVFSPSALDAFDAMPPRRALDADRGL
jgi:hypothetical protein